MAESQQEFSLSNSLFGNPSSNDWNSSLILTTVKGFPAEHLDASPTYYPQNKIEAVIQPYREALINAFFEIVHKSFPVLGPQTPLTIPNESTLMVSIYCLAQPYHPPAQCVDPWLFTDFNKQALPIETHTARLETVEAALLFAQRHASLIR